MNKWFSGYNNIFKIFYYS